MQNNRPFPERSCTGCCSSLCTTADESTRRYHGQRTSAALDPATMDLLWLPMAACWVSFCLSSWTAHLLRNGDSAGTLSLGIHASVDNCRARPSRDFQSRSVTQAPYQPFRLWLAVCTFREILPASVRACAQLLVYPRAICAVRSLLVLFQDSLCFLFYPVNAGVLILLHSHEESLCPHRS